MDLVFLRKKLDEELQTRKRLSEDLKSVQRRVRENTTRLKNTEEAIRIVQTVTKAVQETVHRQIATVVTRCLKAVFGEEAYEFRIDFEKKRGKTEANLVFVRGDLEVAADAVGGGVIDVASFALRVACLLLRRPAVSKVLLLDEPFKMLSVQFRSRVREMLLTISRELGIQIIMVTHSEELVCGKVIELS